MFYIGTFLKGARVKKVNLVSLLLFFTGICNAIKINRKLLPTSLSTQHVRK